MSDWFEDGGDGKAVDVASMLDSNLPELLGELIELGALVSLGTTSDGGALGITVTLDGRWRRGYFRDVEEARGWLNEARDGVRRAVESAHASSGSRKRSRRPRAL